MNCKKNTTGDISLEKTDDDQRTKTDSGKLVNYYGDGLTILKELGKLNL